MDLSRLGKFIRDRVWIIVAVTVLVELLIAGVTLLVSEQYQARSLVRLGGVAGSDIGAQSAVVEQIQLELEDQTQVTVSPRPQNMVLVHAEAPTPTEAVNMTKNVAALLIERSRAAVELALRERKAAVEALKTAIEDVDGHIKVLSNREVERAGSANSVVQYMTAAQLKELFDLRTSVRRQLQQAEVDLIKNVTEPAILWEVKVPAEPFRPRWARNLIVGGLFGVVFGVFLVVLMGVLHQFPAAQHRERQVR